jgi:CheY-like chemotaxis protein
MSQAYQSRHKMVLCIDDSPSILEYERRILEQSGYIVVSTSSAPRGLRLAMLYSFDAILLDYHMPEMNGDQLVQEMRKLRPETPVVMFSGSDIPEETRELVDAVVPKTGGTRELLPVVSRLCDRQTS